MATATKARSFNYELFRKRVRLFDSNAEGERNEAVRQAIGQCARCEPPLHFWEAAGAAFGSVDEEERERLEERAESAESDAENARQDAERLRQENARLDEELRIRPATDDGDVLRLTILASLLDKLEAALAIAISAEWAAVTPVGCFLLGDHAALIAEWLHAVAMGMFLLWSIALYRHSGTKTLSRQLGTWIVGWAVLVGLFGRLDSAFDIHAAGFKQLLVPYRWWGTMGLGFSGLDASVAMIVLGHVIDANAGFPFLGWVWRIIRTLFRESLDWAISAFVEMID